MTKKNRLPLFIVLVLLLAGIIAYIPFSSVTKDKTEKADFKMDVAVVNLDEPIEYQGKTYNFGEEFKKSLENDYTHRFHLVDAAEAEDGILDKRYNMAITIPNDFTKRALSIDNVSPEPIKLSYKLNESNNEITKAQAQKIAGELLNSFNKKVIDVFFASVIGNLQTAQKNVKSIVKKQDQLTSIYATKINDPIKEYTNNLTQINENTNFTKDAFNGLNKELNTFQQNAKDSLDSASTNSQIMATMQEYLEKGNDTFNNLTNLINDSNDQVSVDNAEEKLQSINDEQKLLSLKLEKDMSLVTSNIATNLTSTQENINQYTVSLKKRIDEDISKEVSDLVNETLNDALSTPENTAKINTLFLAPKTNIENNILQTIDQLPSLDEEQVKNLDVSESTKDQLSKIIFAAKKYAKEKNHSYSTDGQFSIQYYIEQMKNKLMTEGTVFSDEMKIPAQEAGNRILIINAPKGFVTKNVVLTLPDGKILNIEPGVIDLPAISKGKIKVSTTFVLADNSVDIFSPLNWSWTLKKHEENITAVNHHDITRISVSKNEDNSQKELNNTAESTEDQSLQKDENLELKKEEQVNPKNNTNENTPIIKKEEQNNQKAKTKSVETKSNDTNQTKTITNEIIHHEITSTLATQEEIPDQVAKSIWNYQRLQALFSLYFDIDVTNPDQFSQLNNGSFEKIGSSNTNSLYYALSNKGMKAFIISMVKKSLIEQTTAKLSEDLKAINNKVIGYNEEISNILKNFPTLIKQTEEATVTAKKQNDEIKKLVPVAQQWKDTSNQLVESSSLVAETNEKEGQVSIDLDGGISDLLLNSSNVAEEAEAANLQASSVFDSFDGINEKARQIKSGGHELSNKADQLANDLVKKVSNDNDYAMNFSNVLANSKIGNAPNEELYDFLSNPINMTKQSIDNTRDTRTTFYLIVIASFLALFTAYVMSGFKQFVFKKSDFENAEEQSLYAKNFPISVFTTSIAIIEGLIVGTVSLMAYKEIEISSVIWMIVITLLMTLLVLAATYLLRQFKMIGMFIILVIISMYLFFTEALGFDFERSQTIHQVSLLSPLHYLENNISNIINGTSSGVIIIGIMFILTILFFILNLFVLKRISPKEVNANEV
ncbi:type VII secretion protein EsaA [Rummeliibacillus pycnus]|uniref:type VII secretion protein EsaA n=1 Tax=Rummeliibacillus pycnus TaxID=101070 RepID=UPI000C9C5078|nr:type VII secretion protein EsaA [Rummeliibacillus pycnus]